VRQIGIVREVGDGFAVVEVSRKSACEGCHASAEGCSACVVLGDKKTTSRAENSLGAGIGDRVELETPSKTVTLYAAAVFLFPVLLGIIGYLIAGALTTHAAAPYIAALAGFALAFVIVYFTLNRRAASRFDVKIVRIL